MSKTELATIVAHRPQTALQASSALSVSAEDRGALYKMASTAVASGLYPGLQSADAAFVIMLKGADLGLAPFEALSAIYLIKGKAHIGYTVLASLMRRHPHYDYRVTELTAEVCTLDFVHHGEAIGSFSFSMEDAKRARLTGNADSNWSKYPQTMLFARCMSLGQRIYCPDLTSSTFYVDSLGEPEVPIYDVTPRDVPTPQRAEQTAAPVPLFGAPTQDAPPTKPADMDVDELIGWAADQLGSPDAAEEILTAHRKANGGDVIYDDFTNEVLAAVGGA